MQTPYGHLTYCTNIHSGESWTDHFRQLQQHLPQVKKAVSPQQPFGIGLRLSDAASKELLEKGNVNIFKAWLQQHGCYVFTMNGFPYGGFHHTVVKEAVHTPDWLTNERVEYTKRLAYILAQLLPEDLDGGISTSPLSYRYWFSEAEKEEAVAKATESILTVAEALIQIKRETGKTIHLDIEPEPDGMLENGAEFLHWYQQTLVPAAIPYFEKKLYYSEAEALAAVKAHITLCYDVCHFAIGYEDHAAYLQQLQEAGIRVGKIQISAALKAALPQAAADRQKVFEAFSRFNEPVYLHQVVARNRDGNLLRYRDLPQALHDTTATAAVEWRAHFHVPIFAESFGLLQSTQGDIINVLALHRAQPFTTHLEVETYTWEVLQNDLKAPLTESVIRELQWVQQQLLKGKTNIFNSHA